MTSVRQRDVEQLYAEELKTTHEKIHRRAAALMAYVDDLEAKVLGFAVAELAREGGELYAAREGLELLASNGNTQHVRDSARAALKMPTVDDGDDDAAAAAGLELLRKLSSRGDTK